MAYRLKLRRSIAGEVRRLADKQLTLAIRELRAVGDARHDNVVHTARRHIKKVRALIRLVEPALGDTYHRTNRRLRLASRLLAPIADGRAVIPTLGRVRAKYGTRSSERSFGSIRTVLLQRALCIDRRAELDRVLPRVARILRLEHARLEAWTLNAHGFHAIATGLEQTLRRARREMARAAAQPTNEHYDAWRRRVKDLWLQLRLIKKRCRNRLVADQRRLEALDGCLGECHNVAVLEQVVMTEALVSRRHKAECLRLFRRYQRALRRHALLLGRQVFREKPSHFIRRVKKVWASNIRRVVRRETRVQWPRAA